METVVDHKIIITKKVDLSIKKKYYKVYVSKQVKLAPRHQASRPAVEAPLEYPYTAGLGIRHRGSGMFPLTGYYYKYLMGYDLALNKAWEELGRYNIGKDSLRFLGDEYSLDSENRKLISLSCNVPAKDFTAILMLHYLARRCQGLPQLSGEWMSFKEMAQVEGYADAFRKRSLEPIIRKYGSRPEGILEVLGRLPAKKVNYGDIGIVIEAFSGVQVLVTLWKADNEFGPEANMLFDRSINQIFCIEDVVVLAGIVAASL